MVDIRKNRIYSLKDNKNQDYTNLDKIKKEVEDAKNTFKKYKWPTIDVTRKSVEETAASVIKFTKYFLVKKMNKKIILASKSKVRKEILDKNNILNTVEHSNVDEDVIKISLLNEKASPEIISKNLAELKANKVSVRNQVS